MKKLIISIFITLTTIFVYSQGVTTTISGYVINSGTNQAVNNQAVYIQADPYGSFFYCKTVYTNINGHYIDTLFIPYLQTVFYVTTSNCNGTLISNTLISSDSPMTSDFSIQCDTTCNANFIAYPDSTNIQIYHFYNTSTGTNTPSIYWDFGDSTNSYDANPVHTFLDFGTYNVCLHIMDSLNTTLLCSYCNSVVVDTADTSACQAHFQYSVSGNYVAFYGYSGNPDQTYSWDFGDTSSSSLTNPTHHFIVTGTYNVCLTVTCSNGTTTLYCQNIIIENPSGCNASFYAYPDSTNTLTYHFYNTSTGTASPFTYTWSFGDGTTLSEVNPVYTFQNIGTYNICLSISDSFNNILCSYCNSIVVDTANSLGCHAYFTYYLQNDGQTFQFVNMSQNNGNYICYNHWFFDDGNFSGELNPTHIFVDTGSYHVCLYYATWNGIDTCYNSYCANILVPVNNYSDSLKFTVQGAVHAGNAMATSESAAVILFNADYSYYNAVDYKIVTNGTFQFDSVMQGNYILWAIPDISIYPNYLPTYYGDALYWQDAYPVNVTANTYDLDIHLLNSDSLFGGKLTENVGSIGGTVLFDNELTYEINVFGQDWFGGKACNGSKNSIAGRNIPIFLKNTNGDIVSWALADVNGNFDFSDLLLQDYTVNAEKASLQSVSPVISLTSATPDVNNISINIGTQNIVTSVENQLSYEILNSMSYYPNPVKDNLTLAFTLVKQAMVDISILNITGQEIKKYNYSLSEGSNKMTMDLNDLSSGIYFVRINVDKGNAVNFKFIK